MRANAPQYPSERARRKAPFPLPAVARPQPVRAARYSTRLDPSPCSPLAVQAGSWRPRPAANSQPLGSTSVPRHHDGPLVRLVRALQRLPNWHSLPLCCRPFPPARLQPHRLESGLAGAASRACQRQSWPCVGCRCVVPAAHHCRQSPLTDLVASRLDHSTRLARAIDTRSSDPAYDLICARHLRHRS